MGKCTPVLALYDLFGVAVPLNCDIIIIIDSEGLLEHSCSCLALFIICCVFLCFFFFVLFFCLFYLGGKWDNGHVFSTVIFRISVNKSHASKHLEEGTLHILSKQASFDIQQIVLGFWYLDFHWSLWIWNMGCILLSLFFWGCFGRYAQHYWAIIRQSIRFHNNEVS